ncbi:MAG: SDR family oxidoreductase [Rhodospirillaceae bacterium]|nr:SDR family oxidoreductase [Rhodospirillaceae bacterium]
MNRIDLAGRVALVTGGAQGIGLAIAERLLRSGAAVTVWDANEARLTKAGKVLTRLGPCETATVDVTDPRAVEASIAALVETRDTLHILVNNAGIMGKVAPTLDQSDADWTTAVDVLLHGTFWCSRAALPPMLAAGWGRIVNIASISGKEGTPNMPAYSAAKAGVIGLTKSMGRELGESGISVNCITPAAIETDLIRNTSPEHHKYMLSNIPMGRFGQVEEIASLAAWLCSEDCSYTTGGVFDASGARSSY